MPIVPMLRLRGSPQNRLIRRLLFATIFFLLNAHLFIYFLHSPNEEASDDLASLWDYNPAVTVPRVHGIGKVYIAANHWISGKILKPYWINGLLMLIQQLGPENVFVSIYENGSWDETPAMLRELDRELGRMGVERRVLIEAITHREQVAEVVAQGDDKPGWVMTSRGKKELRRIPMLAKLRNRLLEPLEELQRQGKGNFDRILFMNDVVFTAEDVITLLRTRDGNYSAACSVDFNKPQYYYDTFALRDIYGQEAASQRFPFFASGKSRNAMMRGDPVPVQSCWNGIVTFDAAPFTRQQKPLRFRGIDDSLSVLHLEGSECCLIHADNTGGFRSLQRSGVWMNPLVRVGYNFPAYRYQRIHMYQWPEYFISIPVRIGTSLIGLPWRNRKVGKRLASWRKETGGDEKGDFCLVDEMHVLVENGWKHV
ncbi:hypothetical protein TWF225_011013 [Orbilia oligospora]|uniref:Uncharacterized protein n=1 Tax=Orbilia oligospora TaxID=2813651 RepID=A0A7C8PF33_ORBOL|nr:hypothetical protein TWF751_009786 [Orbilia oligospora]KAF3193174.1 hypothetical protein TWF225_011013 [Orbilia oligospora]KAF3234479.1 hypothetical protein TWF217_003593 [Orbilia oligospora]KAF3271639.1 hypothetical protein TWF128_000204 [Orbilia oligospora]KAF3295127.1 hypothetical protein TWF132_002444 [Orbilia oligospora]